MGAPARFHLRPAPNVGPGLRWPASIGTREGLRCSFVRPSRIGLRGLSTIPKVAWLLALAPTPASAQLGPDGSEIGTSNYTVDFYAGAVQGSARAVGLGGSYVAIAEGVDGNLTNPATPALRPGYTVDLFDYWLGFAFSTPFSVGDAFNTGGFASELGFDQTGFTSFAPSLNLQFGRFGIGLTLELQTVSLDALGTGGVDDGARLQFEFYEIRVQAAYQLLEGQLILGVGGIGLVQRALGGTGDTADEVLYTSSGFSFELGGLYRPNGEQYRIGAAIEGPVDTSALSDGEGDVVRQGFFVPRGLFKPWELRFGGAYQFGARPLNPVWRTVNDIVDEEIGDLWDEMSEAERDLYWRETWRRLRREYRAQPRRYVLATASLHVIGRTKGATSVEGFLTRRVQRSGEDVVSFSPRFGVETDLVPGWVLVRAGGYIEPSRVEATSPRFHYTFGVDLKLGWWDVFGVWSEDYLWRIGFAADIARDYFSGSLSFGGWY